MVNLNFSRLDSTDFEEFCYELLVELGFQDVHWRKGTPLNASPADQGRDIECSRHNEDIDGHHTEERWFVQCKHYEKGVPPEKIHDAIAWADAKRPDVLLIIASGYLSNACSDYLKAYEETNKPHFKIRDWNKKKLEQLAGGHIGLMNKFKLLDDSVFLHSMHPLHAHYLYRSYTNTLPHFLNILRGLDPDKRDRVMAMTYDLVVLPRSREPVTGKETLRELLIDEVSFEIFAEKCLDVRWFIFDSMFVRSIVEFTLAGLQRTADPYGRAESREDNESMLKFIDMKLDEEIEPEEAKLLRSIRKRLEVKTDKTAETDTEWKELYEWFCESVIPSLAREEFKFKYKDTEFTNFAVHKLPQYHS